MFVFLSLFYCEKIWASIFLGDRGLCGMVVVKVAMARQKLPVWVSPLEIRCSVVRMSALGSQWAFEVEETAIKSSS
jgi:hypothetical protein